MTDEQDDDFQLASAWGFLLGQAQLDQHDEYPKWLPEVFFAMAEAVEKLPPGFRDGVISAAVEKWADESKGARAGKDAS
mgnify:CR=1 FL=1